MYQAEIHFKDLVYTVLFHMLYNIMYYEYISRAKIKTQK